jgi:hypothetical protein
MKSFLFSLFVFSALCLALWARGYVLIMPDFVAIAFSAGLTGWVVESYRRTPQRLALSPMTRPLVSASPRTSKSKQPMQKAA